jgi:hypothetical protein
MCIAGFLFDRLHAWSVNIKSLILSFLLAGMFLSIFYYG